MAFPTDPRIISRSVSTDTLQDTGSTNSFWSEYGTITKTAATSFEIEEGSAIVSKPSRYFSPMCQDVEFDLKYTYSVSATRILRMMIVSDDDGLSTPGNSNTAIEVYIRSNDRIEVRYKVRDSSYATAHNVTESTTVERVRLRLRRFAFNEGAFAWADSTVYAVGDEVRYSGVLWRCYNAHTSVLANDRPGTGTNEADYWRTISNWELDVLDGSDNHLGSSPYGGDFDDGVANSTAHIKWENWTNSSDNQLNMGNCAAQIYMAVNDASGTDTYTVTDFSVTNIHMQNTADTVYGPVVDGMSMELPDIPVSDQPNIIDGILDPSLPPYNCDETGVVDCTTELNDCLATCMDYSMQMHLPADSIFLISDTLHVRQPVYQRSNCSVSSGRKTFADEFRGACIVGSTEGTNKSIIRLDDASSGFGNGASYGTSKPIIQLDTSDYQSDGQPDYEPINGKRVNANYNQTLVNFDVDAYSNNDGAVCVTMQGAQGSGCYNVKGYSSTADTFFATMGDAPGSGAVVAGLHGDGGQYGAYVDTSQPVPVFVGCIFENQTVAPWGFGVTDTGNRHTLVMVGSQTDVAAGLTAILGETGGSTNRGQVLIIDSQFSWASVNAANLLIDTERSFMMENTFLENCAQIVEHPDGDITSPNNTGWVHAELIAYNDDPPDDSTGGITDPDPFVYDADSWLDGVKSATNITTYGTEGVAPLAELTEQHHLPDDFPNWENADINVRVDYSAIPDGLTDNSSAIDSAIAAATSGQTVFFGRGVWRHDDTIEFTDGVNVVGAGVYITHIMPPQAPTTGQPFHFNDTARPLLRSNTAGTSVWSMMNVWPAFSYDNTGTTDQYRRSKDVSAFDWRCSGYTFAFVCRRNAEDGYGSYNGTSDNSMRAPLMKWSGACGDSRHYNMYQGNANNVQSPYSHFWLEDITNGRPKFYMLNGEHVYHNPGQALVQNCDGFYWYGVKGECNYPFAVIEDSGQFGIYGCGGNWSAFIESGVLPPGETEGDEDLDTGYNPEPGDYPTGWTPTLFVVDNCPIFRISQTQDEGRNTGSHPTFGGGTRADYWSFGNVVNGASETYVLDLGARPTVWQDGTFVLEDLEDLPDPPTDNIDVYVRADGTATTLAQAINPASSATSLSLAQLNTLRATTEGLTIGFSDQGGTFTTTPGTDGSRVQSVSMQDDAVYTNVLTEDPVFDIQDDAGTAPAVFFSGSAKRWILEQNTSGTLTLNGSGNGEVARASGSSIGTMNGFTIGRNHTAADDDCDDGIMVNNTSVVTVNDVIINDCIAISALATVAAALKANDDAVLTVNTAEVNNCSEIISCNSTTGSLTANNITATDWDDAIVAILGVDNITINDSVFVNDGSKRAGSAGKMFKGDNASTGVVTLNNCSITISANGDTQEVQGGTFNLNNTDITIASGMATRNNIGNGTADAIINWDVGLYANNSDEYLIFVLYEFGAMRAERVRCTNSSSTAAGACFSFSAVSSLNSSFHSCIFEFDSSATGGIFRWLTANAYDCDIQHCTFYHEGAVNVAAVGMSGASYENCTFNNVDFESDDPFSYDYCHFAGVTNEPTSTNEVGAGADPGFNDGAGGDYSLNESSVLHSAGKDLDVLLDYAGDTFHNSRPAVGAFSGVPKSSRKPGFLDGEDEKNMRANRYATGNNATYRLGEFDLPDMLTQDNKNRNRHE